ncbi:hypothetical protein RDI58_017747 [Solanum bulbocastanum]|uniref:Uncharacterized protein n=1 Tax=Solanum bulbocastanum TaxID=147425 RepID=A0AAN8T9B4_SOLBU
MECRLQRHNEEGCRKLNPHLRNYYKDAEEKGTTYHIDKSNNKTFAISAFPSRTLTSGKVVGDPDSWAGNCGW